MRKSDIPSDMPYAELIATNSPEYLANGGSCIALPNGEWLVPPACETEELILAELDVMHVFEERQNFDVSGHYARPDVTELKVNRKRQSIVEIKD